jgi:putative glycerol-1-phosphate prenyltransferase
LNKELYNRFSNKKGQIAILIDPDKFDFSKKEDFVKRINVANVDYLFVGGSTVEQKDLRRVIRFLKDNSTLPIVLFPGDVYQYDENADAILYLSLLSGRNPDYLIGQHVRTAKNIAESGLEIIPTAYLLIDGGNHSAVAYVSQTSPIPQNQVNLIENTAIAGILQGKSTIYLDAGSGAEQVISAEIIERCSKLEVPLIVGGGIRSIDQIKTTKAAGANVIVIGNHIEENVDFLLDIANYRVQKPEPRS